MIMVKFLLSAVLSYFLGSLNFGVILSKKFENDDVRTHGSGNAGTTNMLRSYGKGIAALTITGDMLKVVVAILITLWMISPKELVQYSLFADNAYIILKSFAGFFCVLGHIFPCFFRFKGGKGVATSGGMVFMIDWRIALILLAIFIVTVFLTKYVSLGSIVMAVLYPVFIFLFHQSAVLTGIAVVFAVIVITAHRENINKLIHHTERKITDKKDPH